MVKIIYAYTRISTNKATQKSDRQIDNIKKFAIENKINTDDIIFINEIISGKVSPNERPKYKHLKDIINKDDILIINDLDRLGRDANSTILEVENLKQLGVKLLVLDIPLLNTLDALKEVGDISINNMIVGILITLKAHIAEQEREKISQRVKQGIAASSKKSGRRETTISNIPADFMNYYKLFNKGTLKKVELQKLTGYSRTTIDKYIKIINDNFED